MYRTSNNGLHIEWRLSRATYHRFRELWQQLDWVSPDSPEYGEIIDNIKSMPGFPAWNDDTLDLIHLTITDLE